MRMRCDHCEKNTQLQVYTDYELQLCDSCNDKFQRKEWQGLESLRALERQQVMFESMAIPYVYSND